jgi:hypothetical protein
MLYDKTAPTPKQLSLVALRPEQLSSIEKEFILDTFTFDRPHAIIQINPGNYMYLNVRDPEDREPTREAKRLTAIHPVGTYRGLRASAQGSVISLMQLMGLAVEWRPCGPSGPVLPFQTCYNASSAVQLYCPRGN